MFELLLQGLGFGLGLMVGYAVGLGSTWLEQ